ncbi:hypothetical protein SAMN05446037_101483 [Anaerovirgula multivorans]|uniref:Uncharacterized protein n=2 Tax=Anaerovirgula multivorans TaxID=312168 RepID=A0A239FXI5_9FIRM|nr:hypothetical protein SAMN05446037_101483 [Anaerovirgula multivorans]
MIKGYRLIYTYNLEKDSKKLVQPIIQFSYINGAERLEVAFTDYRNLLTYKTIEITDDVEGWQNYEEIIDDIMNNG